MSERNLKNQCERLHKTPEVCLVQLVDIVYVYGLGAWFDELTKMGSQAAARTRYPNRMGGKPDTNGVSHDTRTQNGIDGEKEKRHLVVTFRREVIHEYWFLVLLDVL